MKKKVDCKCRHCGAKFSKVLMLQEHIRNACHKARDNPHSSKLKPRSKVAPNTTRSSSKKTKRQSDRGWKKKSKTDAKYKCPNPTCSFSANTTNKIRVHCKTCTHNLGNYVRR